MTKNRAIKQLMDGILLGEQPRWHDGKLWFADWVGQTLYTLTEDGKHTVEAKIGAGTLKPAKANRTTLSGDVLEALPVNGKVQFTVAPRAWTRVAIYPA